ncbi:MAG: winged helix-turn-helix domain-containing protein [Thermoguttaceae bacterium]
MTNHEDSPIPRRWTFDLTTAEALVDGRPLHLTKRQFQLLHFLASHPGEVFSRKQLIEAVQGPDYPATDRSIDSQLVGLRRKLGSLAGSIEAVRGVGYRFALRGDECRNGTPIAQDHDHSQ